MCIYDNEAGDAVPEYRARVKEHAWRQAPPQQATSTVPVQCEYATVKARSS